MIAGGLEDPALVVAQGVACATKAEHYVEPSEEGKEWLLTTWANSDELAQEVFREIWTSVVGENV
jgi:hypothetical protein